MLEIGRNVCVIGAGTMGGGIAAHLANLGFKVTLLDRDQASVQSAFERTKSSRPPHFYIPETADTIRLGSIQENQDWIAEADWVCEAVVEKLDVKQALFAQIEPIVRPDALISTNTSGLQISLLTEGRSESFKQRFLGTHFFNPPRYLKLLELIPTTETSFETIDSATTFLESQGARRVVPVKDTPGFIANRFGMWSMYKAIHVAEKLGLSIEEVDAITGPLIGRPKTGSFRLNDLVGLDIMQDIAQNLIERCPHDPETKTLQNPSSLQYLLDQGWIGGKAGQGFYKKEAGQFLSFDLQAHGYREARPDGLDSIPPLLKLPLAERLQQALDLRDPVGEFLREYLLPTLRYAHAIREEVSHNVQDFDRVMMWGFGWEAGPFTMIDMLGRERIGLTAGLAYYHQGAVLSHDGDYFAPEPEPDFRTFADFPLIDQKPDLNVRDLGDDVLAVTLTTKMGVVTPGVVRGLAALIQSDPTRKWVIGSEAKTYSVGFDLKFFVERIEAQAWDEIDEAIREFQSLTTLLRTAPTVAAVHGFCLGGGYEIAAGCQTIIAAPETQVGLPEGLVGLIPGGGGTPHLKLTHQNDVKQMVGALKLLIQGTMSQNADHAKKLGLLDHKDIVSYHPDRLVQTAKEAALRAEIRPRPEWKPVTGPFLGLVEQMHADLKSKGEVSDYDETINNKAKHVFAKATSFEHALELEREGFMALMKEGLSQARMKHMLESGKPLRN